MPVHKLCKLALLWQEAGFVREAGQLARWLFKLEHFPSLWCPEKEYDEEEGKRLFSHLAKIEPIYREPSSFVNLGDRHSGPSLSYPSSAVLMQYRPPQDSSNLDHSEAHQNSQNLTVCGIAGVEPEIHLSLVETSRISAALTLDGNGTSLGMIRSGDVEIRAFGPQSASLMFGIKGRSMNGWTRTAAYPEVWLEMKHEVKDEELKLDFRFVGIKAEMPLSLSFYVKAPSCQIGNDILKPKSLRRFHGEVQAVSFGNKLKIESGQPHKVQVIPLAGEGCYWDAEFLVSFELHPFIPQASFRLI